MTVGRLGTRVFVLLLGLVEICGMAHTYASAVPDPPDPLPGGGSCGPQPLPLPSPGSPACTGHQFAHKVMAFHVADKPVTDPIPWAHVTNLSDFAVAATSTGALVSAYGFNFCDLQTLVTAGHGQCVRVGLTLVAQPAADDATFKDNIHAFLSSQTAQANLIANLLGSLSAANADGVDVDIEFPRTCHAYSPPGCVDDGPAYVTFVGALAQQVHTWKPGSYVYVAVPQWDYPGLQSRYQALADAADGLQIMGYGYHSPGSRPAQGQATPTENTPGPNSPIHSGAGTVWPPIGTVPDDLNKTFEYYRATLGISSAKLLMGYPFYGIEYPTTSSGIPSDYDWNSTESYWFRSVANPAATTDCDRQFAISRQWDRGSESPYSVSQGIYGPRQLFCEDLSSLTNKLDLATCKHALGSFYWAENYITADHAFWTIVDQRVKLPVAVAPTDSDGDLVADECDNCPTVVNPSQTDTDGDGFGDACDCAPTDPWVHPSSVELNDGKDNNCPGDDGYGMVDELSGTAGFFTVGDKRTYSWPPQSLATGYEVARAVDATFMTACTAFHATVPSIIDPAVPAAGRAYFYLVRATAPNVGSWGADSSSAPRTPSCQ